MKKIIVSLFLTLTILFAKDVSLDYLELPTGDGKTPFESGPEAGEYVKNASWNNWPPDLVVFEGRSAKPFSENDTWDYIRIQRSVFEDSQTFLPAHIYNINKPIIIYKKHDIYGEGLYFSKIRYSNYPTHEKFVSNETDIKALFRVTHCTTDSITIKDIGFIGPDNYQRIVSEDASYLCLLHIDESSKIYCENLWLTSTDYGSMLVNSSKTYFTNISAEYCHTAILDVDAISIVDINYCNFWHKPTFQYGVAINSSGQLFVKNSKFITFEGWAITAMNYSQIKNNYFLGSSNGYGLLYVENSQISENIFNGSALEAMIVSHSGSKINKNIFSNNSEHPEIILLHDGEMYCENVTISENVFKHTNETPTNVNHSIIAIKPGESFSDGARNCQIFNNTFSGSERADILINNKNNTLYSNIHSVQEGE